MGITVKSTAEVFVQPILQYDAKTKLFRLMTDYSFEWGPKDMRKRLIMAAGFEYDKASVPKILWGIARPDGPWEAAALMHDRLYRDEGKFPHPELFRFETLIKDEWIPDLSKWKRPDMDNLLEYMGVLGGAPKAEAKTYKWAVKMNPVNWFKPF